MITAEGMLQLQRKYPHRRELVFNAWTDERQLEQWFCPNPGLKVDAKLNVRVGGEYRIAIENRSGDPWVVFGVFEEIVRSEKLVMSWQWENPPEDERSLVTLDFIEDEDGTTLVVTHERLSNESRDNHGQSWVASLERLGDFLSSSHDSEEKPDFGGAGAGAAAMVNQAKQVAAMSLSRLRDTLNHVPDDRLLWTPSPSARPALKIAAHVALSNRYFASVLRGDKQDERSVSDVVEDIVRQEAPFQTRAEVNRILEETTGEVLAAYDRLSAERVSDPRVAFIMTLVGRHADGHAAQIDYLQTTWGDMEDHFGM